MGKGSYRMIGKLLQIKHTLVYRWIREFGQNLPEPHVLDDIGQVEFDVMAVFVGLKKENLIFKVS